MGINLLLNQSCDVYPSTIGVNGLPGYGGTATYSGVKCRMEQTSRQVQGADGTIYMSDGVLFLGSSATIAKNDKVVIGSQSYIVDRIFIERGLAGDVHHYECMCREI
jgi:hypothetical protein